MSPFVLITGFAKKCLIDYEPTFGDSFKRGPIRNKEKGNLFSRVRENPRMRLRRTLVKLNSRLFPYQKSASFGAKQPRGIFESLNENYRIFRPRRGALNLGGWGRFLSFPSNE